MSPPSRRPEKYMERVPSGFRAISRAALKDPVAGLAVAKDFLEDRGGSNNWLVKWSMSLKDPGSSRGSQAARPRCECKSLWS